jgi:hypothetical protein
VNDRLWWVGIWIPILAVALAIVLANFTAGAEGASARGRRLLWRGLGLLWLADGLLQLQPGMFGGAFVHGVLLPAATGQPFYLARFMAWAAMLWSHAPALFDLAAALLQTGIGLAVLAWPAQPRGRWALSLSLGWALIIWVAGEGLGGILNGQGSWFQGGPGAALLYGLGAGLLILDRAHWDRGLPARVIAGLAFLGAVFQAVGPYWSRQGMTSLFAGGEHLPVGVGHPATALAGWLGLHAVWANGFFVALMLILALVWWRGVRHPALYAGLSLFLLFIWWAGQGFGILGGLGTDPNTVPVLLLLMASADGLRPGGAEAGQGRLGATIPARTRVASRQRSQAG